MKNSLWLALMAGALIAMVPGRAEADRDPPQSQQASQIVSLVDKAAALIEAKW